MKPEYIDPPEGKGIMIWGILIILIILGSSALLIFSL